MIKIPFWEKFLKNFLIKNLKQMNFKSFVLLSLLTSLLLFSTSCKKDQEGCTDSNATNFDSDAITDDGSCEYSPQLIFKFKFDPNQERLGNFGEPAPIPSGHAAQTPTFNLMGAHYIELSKQGDIPAYNGTQIVETPTTTAGGASAIDFDEALYAGDGEMFYATDLKSIPAGIYKYLRISLSYQNYTINFRAQNTDLQGTIASFVGANTFIRDYKVNNETIAVNENKLQGYWAFETDFPNVPVIEGQAPAGATTVPNPIANLSAIPIGSCLVTGEFPSQFEITGNETEDIIITCEWKDNDGNGTYDPVDGDEVVDMGVRGLIPIVEN